MLDAKCHAWRNRMHAAVHNAMHDAQVFPKELFGELIDRLEDRYSIGKLEQERRSLHSDRHLTLNTRQGSIGEPLTDVSEEVIVPAKEPGIEEGGSPMAISRIEKVQETLRTAGLKRKRKKDASAKGLGLEPLQDTFLELGSHLEHLTPSFFKTLQLDEHPSLATSREASVTSHIQLGLHVVDSLQKLHVAEIAKQLAATARALETALSDAGLTHQPRATQISSSYV